MHSVPNYTERLQALQFKQNFDIKCNETRPDIRAAKLASQEMKTSVTLQKLLDVILWAGNFLNASTPKGEMMIIFYYYFQYCSSYDSSR